MACPASDFNGGTYLRGYPRDSVSTGDNLEMNALWFVTGGEHSKEVESRPRNPDGSAAGNVAPCSA